MSKDSCVFSEFNPSEVSAHPNLLDIPTFKKQYKISFTLVIHSTSTGSTNGWQNILEVRGAVTRHPALFLYTPTMVSKERIKIISIALFIQQILANRNINGAGGGHNFLDKVIAINQEYKITISQTLLDGKVYL